MFKISFQICFTILLTVNVAASRVLVQRSTDYSIQDYLTELVKNDLRRNFEYLRCPELTLKDIGCVHQTQTAGEQLLIIQRICWWNEVCKEEFRSQFRCKCPEWSFCRAPGRYYNAYCSMTTTGYIWSQPDLRKI